MRGKKAAFTLSEVLITIGIIGVVAALVMGVIIPQIQDRQNIAKWKKEYSVISNAFQQTLSESLQVCMYYDNYGGCTYGPNGYHVLTDEFRESLMSKLRVVDSCSRKGESGLQSCQGPTLKTSKTKWSAIQMDSPFYKSLGGSSIDIGSHNFNAYSYLLSDGTTVYLGGHVYGPWIVVDVNNAQNGPNELGRDLFVIHITSNILTNNHFIRPAGAQGTPSWNDSTMGISGCSKDIGQHGTHNGEIRYAAGAGCSAKYLGNY